MGKGNIGAVKKLKKLIRFIWQLTLTVRERQLVGIYCMPVKLDPEKTARVTFNEISKDVVKKSIKEAREIDMDLVNAQQARRELDRIVGYKISPLLWKKVKKESRYR